MKRLIVFTAAALLAACQPASTTANDVPKATVIAHYQNINVIAKVCDTGRAVYVAFPRGGIAVVENAPECQPVMRP